MREDSTIPSRHIALLRGINVGGHNKLPMKNLAAMFQQAGCSRVQTYIQSGNVVLQAETKLADQLPFLIRESIRQEFGLEIPIVMRSGKEIHRIVQSNPFLPQATDTKELSVGFLATKPDPSQIANLDPQRSPPDEFLVQGCEIYFRFPNGLARSKLTNAYFDSKLKTISTVRNWRPVCELAELAFG